MSGSDIGEGVRDWAAGFPAAFFCAHTKTDLLPFNLQRHFDYEMA